MSDQNLVTKIQTILENEIKPALEMDGGDVEFIRYDDKKVYVKLKGACQGCPGAIMTLKFGIENRLKEEIPEIEEVISI